MKILYLIRHAKSSWKDASLSDFERPLNGRGKRDAPFMGGRLGSHSVLPDIIVTSPAKRARQTAHIIAGETGYDKQKIREEAALYLASQDTLLETTRGLANHYDSAFLFGHNPGITLFSNYLTTHVIENVPTCGIVCIEFETESWLSIGENRGSLIFFDYPKRHI